LLYAQNAIGNVTSLGGETMTPIPTKTPKKLHPALVRLSELCDLVAYADVVGRATMYGDRPGPDDWYHTRTFVEKYCTCTPDEAVELFCQAGAENDIEAMFHVVNGSHLLP
jgi:hypothetical protein